MRLRPCIDLHNGKVKQIVGGTLRDGVADVTTNFETDLTPSWYANLYKKDNLSGGHVIMLGPGNEVAACEALQSFPGGLHIGGGINPSNAGGFLDAGASHVIVTSYVFKGGCVQWSQLEEMIGAVGPSRLVLDLSCKKRDGTYYIVTDRWQTFSTIEVNHETVRMLSDYCDEFLVHAADVEGMRRGIDEELVEILVGCAEKPITYAGGVRSLDDLDKINTIGKSKIDVTIGSALDIFGGNLRYDDVVNYCKTIKKHV